MSTLNDLDRENLVAYLDGELDEESAQALEAKINLDPQARAEVDSLRQTWGMLDYLPRPAPSTSFTNRTMERLSLERLAVETAKIPVAPASSWRSNLGWAAAVLIAAGGGFAMANLLWPGPRDFTEQDEVLVKHLRVIEKFANYQHVDNFGFLHELDQPDLFGDEGY